MSDRAPIPPETFEAAVDRLDRDALAAFVGRLEAAAGDVAVDVDPPVVAVSSGGDRERVLVVPGADPDASELRERDPPPDAVVVPNGSSPPDCDVPVRTTADLRRQLLYAVPPAAADPIAEEWLNAPARSASYPAEPASTAAESANDGDRSDEHRTDGDAVSAASKPRPAESGDRSTAEASGGSTAEASDGQRDGSVPGRAGDRDPADRPGRGPPPATPDRSNGPGEPPGGATTRSTGGLAVVGVGAILILAVAAGVVYAAEVSADGDAGAFAVAASDNPGVVTTDLRRRLREPVDGNGAVEPSTSGDPHGAATVRNDTDANRNVRPVPTCERSFLHVVQIQMNALKYNNNTTDDGIRTVRRFASPQNRQTIPTFEGFVRVIESPTYRPMLSYDSAQYTPLPSSGDYAQVRVLTRENGTVTGRYYFRLRKVDGGEYDGCWMTDAVVSLPGADNFSAKVGGRFSRSVNGTA